MIPSFVMLSPNKCAKYPINTAKPIKNRLKYQRIKNKIIGINIEWKNFLWPNIKLTIFEIKGNFLPILLLSESISGNDEDKAMTNTKIILFGISKKIKINNATRIEKARWVLNIIFQFF